MEVIEEIIDKINQSYPSLFIYLVLSKLVVFNMVQQLNSIGIMSSME